MVRVVRWLESKIYKYSPCLKTDDAQNRGVSEADILSVSLFEFVWYKKFYCTSTIRTSEYSQWIHVVCYYKISKRKVSYLDSRRDGQQI